MKPKKIFNKNKKSQLKMGETMAILLIFFILIGLGLIFYGGVQRSLLRTKIDENFEKKAVLIAQRVSFLPEVQCSFKNNVRESCFDMYKVVALSEMADDDAVFLFYRRDFEDSRISVREVYPGDASWVLYDNTPPNYTTAIPTYIPISIFNASKHYEKAFAFGYLNVTVYK